MVKCCYTHQFNMKATVFALRWGFVCAVRRVIFKITGVIMNFIVP